MTSPFEWDWLDPRTVVSLAELSLASGMSAVDLDELVDYGALIPLGSARSERVFSAECARPLSKACKLRADFHLDIFTVVLLLGYLVRIEVLERQARTMNTLSDSRHRPRGVSVIA